MTIPDPVRRPGRSLAARFVAFLAVLLLTACGAGPGADSADGPVTIAVQGLNMQTIYPMAAQDLGYFDDAGVDVKVVMNSSSGAQAIQGMLGGSYQMFFGGADSIVATALGEKNLRIIAAGANSSIWNIVADKSVTSVRDLRGRKIAVLSKQGLLTQAVRYSLAENGVPEKSVTIVPAGNTPQRIAALSSGQADAAVVSVPQNYSTVQKHGYRDLGDLGDLGAPRLVAVALQVDKRWASEHRDEVTRILTGYRALVSDLYSGKNDDEIVPYFAKKLSVDEKLVRKGLDTTFRKGKSAGTQLPKDLGVDVDSLQNTADAFKAYGAIDKRVDVRPLVDTSYLEAAQRRR